MKVNVKIAPLLLFLAALAGCNTGYGRWSRNVAAFSNRTAPALNRAANAFTEAEAVHTLQEEAVLANDYAQSGYRPGELTSFISSNDMAVRQAAIHELTQYATMIGALADGKKLPSSSLPRATTTGAARSESQSAATTETVNASTKITTTVTTAKTLSQQQMNYALEGVNYAFRMAIEHKVRKSLVPIMREADPSVQQTCSLLEADMETIRSQEKGDYTTLLIQQNEFIRNNSGSMDAVEKRAQVMKLFQIERDAAVADANLVNAETALKQLAAAHHALAEGGVK